MGHSFLSGRPCPLWEVGVRGRFGLFGNVRVLVAVHGGRRRCCVSAARRSPLLVDRMRTGPTGQLKAHRSDAELGHQPPVLPPRRAHPPGLPQVGVQPLPVRHVISLVRSWFVARPPGVSQLPPRSTPRSWTSGSASGRDVWNPDRFRHGDRRAPLPNGGWGGGAPGTGRGDHEVAAKWCSRAARHRSRRIAFAATRTASLWLCPSVQSGRVTAVCARRRS